MIFSKYRETCGVLLDYLKIGGDDIVEDYAKKGIRNLLHANIDVHSRRLISELPKDGIKCEEVNPALEGILVHFKPDDL